MSSSFGEIFTAGLVFIIECWNAPSTRTNSMSSDFGETSPPAKCLHSSLGPIVNRKAYQMCFQIAGASSHMSSSTLTAPREQSNRECAPTLLTAVLRKLGYNSSPSIVHLRPRTPRLRSGNLMTNLYVEATQISSTITYSASMFDLVSIWRVRYALRFASSAIKSPTLNRPNPKPLL